MLICTVKLHFGLAVILSFGLARNVSTSKTGTALENYSDVLVDIYGKHPLDRSLDFVDLDQYLDHRVKRILSDYGYGSRLQVGENIANSLDREGLFGPSGPGKRGFEMTGMLDNAAREVSEKHKRINTDYGYGSRLGAGENVAMDWDSHGLFGMEGPGKRSDIVPANQLEIPKRISADFGYGSRSRAAENAAKSASYGELFGTHGPGKRSVLRAILGDVPYNGLAKRISSDYGYGSRLQAAENVAKLASSENLFGVYGPGKRSYSRTAY